MKRIMVWLFVSVFIIVSSFVAIGCKSVPSETAVEEEAVEEEAVEEEVVEEEVVEEEVVAETNYKFYFVCQFPVTDVFQIVYEAAQIAGAQIGAEIVWVAPDSQTVQDEVDMLITTINAEPDGIALMLTDPLPFDEICRDALDSGIPIVTFNTGDSRPKEEAIPFLSYTGAAHYESGVANGEQILKLYPNPQRVVFCTSLPGHAALDARQQGVLDVMEKAGVPAEALDVGSDMTKVAQNVVAYATVHPEADVFVGSWSGVTTAMMTAQDEGALSTEIQLTNFDIADNILDGIKSGRILLTIDQQPFLQGYEPVHQLFAYLVYGITPDPFIQAGPAVVDASNIDTVIENRALGYR